MRLIKRYSRSTKTQQLRNARLLFADQLDALPSSKRTSQNKAVVKACRSAGSKLRPIRQLERLALKIGLLSYKKHCYEPLAKARRSVLGKSAGKPKLLIRVDEFPHYGAFDESSYFGTNNFTIFNSLMMKYGIPYLIAVTPRVALDPLNPAVTLDRSLSFSEERMLKTLLKNNVTFALHGFNHRTRFSGNRKHSELIGVPDSELIKLLAASLQVLENLGITADVFVPPYNRMTASQLHVLAQYFKVICGGPETIPFLGFRRTPTWIGDAIYLPSYPPMYAKASTVLANVHHLLNEPSGVWVPITLHWGWELQDQWKGLENLLRKIGPYTRPWSDFFSEAQLSCAIT